MHLQINSLSHSFGAVSVIRDLDLQVEQGESMALLGPSGCGKTTLLRAIAGLERPLSGDIYLSGRQVTSQRKFVAPEQRKVGMVFQDWALFPHLNVRRNVAFGLARPERTAERIAAALEMVGLAGFEERMPSSLSGGQQQRVALARALAPRPQILLLDEPFSNLDSNLRVAVRTEVRQLLLDLGITTVLVTHDQDEAFVMGDRVGVLHDGALLQVGTPAELYNHPVDRFVANFVGTASWLNATSDGLSATSVLGRLPLARAAVGSVMPDSMTPDSMPVDSMLPAKQNGQQVSQQSPKQNAVTIMLRPEQLVISPAQTDSPAPADSLTLSDSSTLTPTLSSANPEDTGKSQPIGIVSVIEYYGHDVMAVVTIDDDQFGDGQLRVRCEPNVALVRGDKVRVAFTGTSVTQFEPLVEPLAEPVVAPSAATAATAPATTTSAAAAPHKTDRLPEPQAIPEEIRPEEISTDTVGAEVSPKYPSVLQPVNTD